MKYSVEKQDDYAVLTLQEENLNSVKAPELKSELIVLRNAGIENLILNLEHVKYVDSSGLSAILTGNRLWTEDKKQFMLTGINHPSVKMLITISRLDSVLSITENLNDAVKQLMLAVLRDQIDQEQDEETAESEDELA